MWNTGITERADKCGALSDLRFRAVFERRRHGKHARTPIDGRRDRSPIGDIGHGNVDASQAQRI
ncbi:hypothetical protein Pd630_LPD04539 [Rhodococcus opacus PD630]|nr:hypothetical protein Pd630_LPD04539 [Rhodococcus opacus PD630]